MAVNGKRASEMESFWNSLPAKVKAALYRRDRRLIISSDDVPLLPFYPSRIKSLPKYYLFDDAFVILQGTTLMEYLLEWIWVQHIIDSDSLQYSSNNMTSFRITLPETHFDLQCKEFVHKSMWVSSLVEAVSQSLQVVTGRGDLTMDTKLELIRSREFMQYTFQSLPELKDVRYKGQWLNGKPHGIGEFWHEPSGKLYKGGFKKGKFHGKGELLWFADSEYRKKYIGEFRSGKMDGKGEMKYSNGDVYDGQWSEDKREGFGRLEEASRKNSMYCGGWVSDKRHGYGVYDNRMKHERYLGMWSENQRCGPGIVVTSTGTYCEAVFGTATNDGLIMDLSGSSFMGKIGSEFKLAGKGILMLNNGVTIEGYFGGSWHSNIDIQRATLSNSKKRGSTSSSDKNFESWRNSLSELQIAKLDKRIGTCTVLASNKWHPLYEDCEKMLGFSGNAASDVLTAWSRIAEGAFESKRSNQLPSYFEAPIRRASSLNTISKTVRAPGELISLERARAMTLQDSSVEDGIEVKKRTMDDLEASLMKLSIEHSSKLKGGAKIKISGPLHLQEEMVSSYPPTGTGLNYSPQADRSPPLETRLSSLVEESDEEEKTVEAPNEKELKEINLEEKEISGSSSIDTNQAIQRYIDQAFNTPTHPLGILMNRIEMVFRDSYGGIGANKFLLPHAISEVQYIIKRLHSIIRILFPFLDGNDHSITAIGLTRFGDNDPDDYLCINSGYTLLHPLVFQRIFPTLKMLYILHHANDDKEYSRGIDILSEMNIERLAHFIHFPQKICKELLSDNNTMLKELLEAAAVLQRINTLYTPGEFLDLFRMAFQQLSNIQHLSCDVLLPSVVFIIVKASVPHLGAYLHFLTDFAHSEPADEYTLVTYEAAYNFIRRQDMRSIM